MELRRFLFERRITQAQIARAAATLGLFLDQSDLSKFVNHNFKRGREQTIRDRVRRALLAVPGVTPTDVHSIVELREPKRTAREA